MILHYPERLRWQKSISDDLLKPFGKNGKHKITALLKKYEDCGISYTFEPLTEEFFTWFTPLYTDRIKSKTMPKVHDVYEKTFANPPHQYPYYTLTVKENGLPIGGTIFSVRDNRTSIAYRAYVTEWNDGAHRCSPALFAEYLIDEYTRKLGFATLTHGSDTNIYGEHLDVGIAIFKLSVGCHPALPLEYKEKTIETESINSNKLIFCMPQSGTVITDAHWYTSQANQTKYEQLLKYSEQIKVTVNLID